MHSALLEKHEALGAEHLALAKAVKSQDHRLDRCARPRTSGDVNRHRLDAASDAPRGGRRRSLRACTLVFHVAQACHRRLVDHPAPAALAPRPAPLPNSCLGGSVCLEIFLRLPSSQRCCRRDLLLREHRLLAAARIPLPTFYGVKRSLDLLARHAAPFLGCRQKPRRQLRRLRTGGAQGGARVPRLS